MSNGAQPALIYKILRPGEWAGFRSAARFDGGDDDQRDGFIHFSTAAQLPGTLARHFGGDVEVVICAVAAADLGAALRWEPSRQGQLFPHLYAALPYDRVAGHWPIVRDGAAGFTLPAEIV